MSKRAQMTLPPCPPDCLAISTSLPTTWLQNDEVRRRPAEAYRFLGEGKNAASLKQIWAALSLAYKHWDVKNPFAKIAPPIHRVPQVRYLLLADIRQLFDYLKAQKQGYGSALAFHLANALFQTACWFDELIQLKWENCQAVGKEIVGPPH